MLYYYIVIFVLNSNLKNGDNIMAKKPAIELILNEMKLIVSELKEEERFPQGGSEVGDIQRRAVLYTLAKLLREMDIPQNSLHEVESTLREFMAGNFKSCKCINEALIGDIVNG